MIQIREYATLTTATDVPQSLDCATVSEQTFDWLVELATRWKAKEPVLLVESKRAIKVGSHVGYLRSPHGEAIEILPKTGLGQEDPTKARRILQRMLRSSLDIDPREASSAELLAMNVPIHEWVYSQFLRHLSHLLRRGLRFWYEDIEEESRFLRGQLQATKQMRQPPDRRHLFHIRHALFTPDRIENRLLRTALDYVRQHANSPENWRLANELGHRLDDIPAVRSPLLAMTQWQDSKLMVPYRTIRPWCRLILERLNPNFQKGEREGISLLFPMEKLFERHVEVCLRRELGPEFALTAQACSEHLLEHQPHGASRPQSWFQLKPDLLLRGRRQVHVLDTKWKLLEEQLNTTEHKYRINQADLYQLFAYGQKYQGGEGDMMLIYPKHPGFLAPLPPFHFDDRLRLWAVPFNLEGGTLVGGAWCHHFPTLWSKQPHEHPDMVTQVTVTARGSQF